MVGLIIVYPGQSAQAKYCGARSEESRCSRTETPFGAYAYLCRSTETDVTPGTEKPTGAPATPVRRSHGSAQPPKHASTWQRTPAAAATSAICATGSITPWA